MFGMLHKLFFCYWSFPPVCLHIVVTCKKLRIDMKLTCIYLWTNCYRMLDKTKDEKVLNPVKFQQFLEKEQKVIRYNNFILLTNNTLENNLFKRLKLIKHWIWCLSVLLMFSVGTMKPKEKQNCVCLGQWILETGTMLSYCIITNVL